MIIKGNGIYDAWVLLLDELLQAPVVSPRGKPCRERIGVQLRVADARRNIICDAQRGLNYRFLVCEWLWILAGLDRLDVLTRYNKNMAEFSDDGKTLTGAYGPRLQPQWAWLLDRLASDLESRQGVVSIWTPKPASSKDVPCTLSAQYFVRREDPDGFGPTVGERRRMLHTVMTMRSSDAWWGVPYDFFTFAQLANVLAAALSHRIRQPIYLGELVLNLGSSHLYEPHWEAARSIVNAPTGMSGLSPRLPAGQSEIISQLPEILTYGLEDTRDPATLGPHNSEGHWGPCRNANHDDSQEGPCDRGWVVDNASPRTQPDTSWWPWPWRQYVECLRAPGSTDALIILQNLERREGHAATL